MQGEKILKNGQHPEYNIKNNSQLKKIKQNYSSEIYTVTKFKQEVKETDQNMKNMDWDILTINENQTELQRLVWSVLHTNKWLEQYKIEFHVFVKFLNILEYKYNKKKNPFHNFTHGVAVMQATYAICQSDVSQRYLNDFDIFTLTLSGLCHDVSHPAHTNIFAINSLSKLAIRYHDESPLEQHHAATTFKIIKRIDLFKNIDKDTYKQFRKKVISNILYTDNSKHQKLLQTFSERQQAPNKFGDQADDVDILSGVIIHTADFTGAARPFETSRQWSSRVNLEFSEQYNLEGELGLVQTPFMKDLDKAHIMAKGEIGFFKFLVLPLWSQLNSFLDGYLQQNVQSLQKAVEKWQQIYEENKPEN